MIPFSFYQILGLGELNPTSTTLCLVDKSIEVPKGVVEDVLIYVDIILLDKEWKDEANPIPIILGRPFLVTSNAWIMRGMTICNSPLRIWH